MFSLRFIFTSVLLGLALLGASTTSAQINPANQISWPSCSGGALFYDIVHNTCVTGASPGSPSGSMQYNNNGSLGGLSAIVTGVCDGSTNDTTAFQTASSGLTSGGQIVVPVTGLGCIISGSSGFDLPNRGTSLVGLSRGFNVDPNGVSEGSSGAKLKVTGSGQGVHLGAAASKIGGLTVERIYFWGATTTNNTAAAIYLDNQVDQAHLDNIDIGGNFAQGLYVTSVSDDLQSHRFEADGLTGYGIYFTSASTVSYSQFTECTFADNNNSGFYQETSTATNNMWLRISNCLFTRNVHSSQTNPGNLVVGTNYASIVNVTSRAAGYSISGLQVSGASDLILNGNHATVVGGVYTDSSGCGITINSNNNNVSAAGFGNNATADICVSSGASDNRLYVATGTVISDSGTRTVVNDVSTNAGDPNSTGQWNGITKWAGLVINDTTNSITWLYQSASSRVQIGGGASGVSSLNSLTGGLAIIAGSGISVTPSGSNIQIACTGCSGGSANVVNITSLITWSGCTVSGTSCVVGTPGTSITASSIPSTYTHLRIVIMGQESGASTDDIVMQVGNGTVDTGSNYDWAYGAFIAGAPYAPGSTTATTNMHCGNLVSHTVTSRPAVSQILLFNYANTNWFREISCIFPTWNGTNATQGDGLGYWKNAASAIDTFKLTVGGTDNFAANTTVQVYGEP